MEPVLAGFPVENPGIGIVLVVLNVGGKVDGAFARELRENADGASGRGGCGNEQHGVGIVQLEPGNDGVGFADGGGVVVAGEEYGGTVEHAEPHEVFRVKVRVALVAVNPAPENDDGIDLAFGHEFCCEVVAFQVGSLPVQQHGPFHVGEFVVLHEPETALRYGDVEEDNEEYERDGEAAKKFLAVLADIPVFHQDS